MTAAERLELLVEGELARQKISLPIMCKFGELKNSHLLNGTCLR